MPHAAAPGLIAVDVGNSRIKLGRFDRSGGAAVPEPAAVLDLPLDHTRGGPFNPARLNEWCDENVPDGATWLAASVNDAARRTLSEAVEEWSRRRGIHRATRTLTYRDLPLAIRVEEPARVGIDRLLGALAADRLRRPDRAAIIVDLGTAITVDLLEADGAFAGGAILPGIAMSARALADHTAALPHVAIDTLAAPPQVPGKSTTAAIEAGLFWGAVGAIRELIARTSEGLRAPPDVFLTGGASGQVAQLFSTHTDRPIRHVPHLVLSGIALLAEGEK